MVELKLSFGVGRDQVVGSLAWYKCPGVLSLRRLFSTFSLLGQVLIIPPSTRPSFFYAFVAGSAEAMDQTFRPSPSPSSGVLPFHSDNTVPEAAAHCALSEPYQNLDSSRTETGLGISQCDAEILFDQLKPCSAPEACLFHVPGWSTHSLQTEPFCGTTMSIREASPASLYEPCGLTPDMSNSPLSYCTAQTLGPSPIYEPGFDLSGSYGQLREPFLDTWAKPAQTETTAPFKEDFDDSQYPMFFPAAHDASISMLPQLQSLTTDDPFMLSPQLPIEIASSQALEPDVTVIHIPDRTRRATVHEYPTESILQTGNRNVEGSNGGVGGTKLPRRKNSSTGNDLRCTICGFQFTRRSNCREHMKKHNPSYKREHLCCFCGRPFERRADLRRHMDSVSYTLGPFESSYKLT